MKTSQPVTFITHNSPGFLKMKLDEMREGESPLIQEYTYIFHQGEDDEAGSKAHAHVYLLPARAIDMAQFRDRLKEPDPPNPLPIRPLPLRRCNSFKDWYLYGLHDPIYLAKKLESRKYHYKMQDFVASDPNWFVFLTHEAAQSTDKDMLSEKLGKAFACGLTWDEVLVSGILKAHEIYGGDQIWQAILRNARGELDRHGRPGHEPSTDDLLEDDIVAQSLLDQEPQYDPSKVIQLTIQDTDTDPVAPGPVKA